MAKPDFSPDPAAGPDRRGGMIRALQQMLFADRLARAGIRRMHAAASDAGLVTALENAVCGVGEGIETVERVLGDLGSDRDGRHCPAMEGLVACADHEIARDYQNDAARDTALALAFHRITHFGLASYEALAHEARAVGEENAADTLQTCLDNAKDGEKELVEWLEKRAK